MGRSFGGMGHWTFFFQKGWVTQLFLSVGDGSLNFFSKQNTICFTKNVYIHENGFMFVFHVMETQVEGMGHWTFYKWTGWVVKLLFGEQDGPLKNTDHAVPNERPIPHGILCALPYQVIRSCMLMWMWDLRDAAS